MLPAAGHMANVDQPEAFNAAVEDFLDRRAAPRSRPWLITATCRIAPTTRREARHVELTFSEEQLALRDAVRRFLRDRSPVSEVRRLMATADGFDRDVWTVMAQQLGLQGLTVPEEHGGSGFGPVEQLVVLEEMGAVLLCAPYLGSAVLATSALLHSEDPAACADLLPGLADGTVIGALAVAEADGRWDADGRTTARAAGRQHLLRGTKSFVLDGHVADLLLVVAGTDQGPGLFAVDAAAEGVDRRLLDTLDQTRKQATVTFSDAPARLVGAPGSAAAVLRRILPIACAALAAEQVGGAQRCLDLAVHYARTRVQFGRPIGSFQAVKHRCADMLLEVEWARSTARAAAWAAQDRPDELPLLASLAKAQCSDAFTEVAAGTIQVHGGIGFTWDHDAHLYYRRAVSSAALLGGPALHREVAAGLLLDGDPVAP